MVGRKLCVPEPGNGGGPLGLDLGRILDHRDLMLVCTLDRRQASRNEKDGCLLRNSYPHLAGRKGDVHQGQVQQRSYDGKWTREANAFNAAT